MEEIQKIAGQLNGLTKLVFVKEGIIKGWFMIHIWTIKIGILMF